MSTLGDDLALGYIYKTIFRFSDKHSDSDSRQQWLVVFKDVEPVTYFLGGGEVDPGKQQQKYLALTPAGGM